MEGVIRKWPRERAHTWIFSSFIPVDKTGNQHNEGEQSNGAQQANKPALARYSPVDAGKTWGEENFSDFDTP